MIPLGFLASGVKIYDAWSKSSAPATVPYHGISYIELAAGNWFMFGTGSANANTNNYYYSTDGSSWTTGTLPVSDQWGLSAHNGTYLVAYQYFAGGSSVYTTTNGTTWTARSVGSTSTAWTTMKYLDGRWWIGSNSNTARYSASADASTWGSVSGISSVNDIEFGNGTHIIVGGNKICTSDPTNAANWTSLTLPTVSGASASTIAFGNGIWVVGYGGASTSTATYAYSTDGTSWSTGTLPAALGTFRTSPVTSVPNTRIRFESGAFYYSIDNSVYYSTDGINWSTASSGTGFTFNSQAIASNGSEAIMVGVGGTQSSNVSQYLKGA